MKYNIFSKKIVLIVVLLVLTNSATFWWSQFMRPTFTETVVGQHPYIDPARDFIPQEDFIVNIQPLRKSLNAKVAAFEAKGGRVSLYLEFLNTGANISINKETYIYPASLTKIPIAMLAMYKVEHGTWGLGSELVFIEADRDFESGDLGNPIAKAPAGTRFTLEELLKKLLIESDNSAAWVLFRNIEEEDVQALIDEVGLEELASKEGKYSAKEYARLLRSLYTSSFLSREGSQQILRWLDNATFNEFLSHPLPSDVPFPHKYGSGETLDGTAYYADSGIVYITHRPYLISVMVEGTVGEPFKERSTVFIREVSKEVYDYFSTYKK